MDREPRNEVQLECLQPSPHQDEKENRHDKGDPVAHRSHGESLLPTYMG